jgi:hypothetical protein
MKHLATDLTIENLLIDLKCNALGVVRNPDRVCTFAKKEKEIISHNYNWLINK